MTTPGQQNEQRPFPRTREAVDWWLKELKRDSVLTDQQLLTREDLERLIVANNGTADGLELAGRKLTQIELGPKSQIAADGNSIVVSPFDLQFANLTGADLSNAWLYGANLRGTRLREANLSGARLKQVNLREGRLHGVNLKKADLFQADIQDANLFKANLAGACLNQANLRNSRLHGANLQNCELRGANLEGCDLSGANLRGADLSGAKLANANLRQADLSHSFLVGTDLKAVDLREANLDCCNFEGAIAQTDMSLARMNGAIFTNGTKFKRVNWGNNLILVDEREGSWRICIDLYRELKQWHQSSGDYESVGKFHYREWECKRKLAQEQRDFLETGEFWLYRIVSGYGERPKRVLGVSLAVILFFALVIYLPFTLPHGWSPCLEGSCWPQFANGLWKSLYFSGVSFTALGYGEWVSTGNVAPIGWPRFIGVVESLFGVSLIALFLVTFTRKMSR